MKVTRSEELCDDAELLVVSEATSLPFFVQDRPDNTRIRRIVVFKKYLIDFSPFDYLFKLFIFISGILTPFSENIEK